MVHGLCKKDEGEKVFDLKDVWEKCNTWKVITHNQSIALVWRIAISKPNANIYSLYQ